MLCIEQEQKPLPIVPNFGRKKKPLKLSVFIPMCIEQGIVRPTDIKREYEAKYPIVKKKTLEAYLWQCKKLGLTKEKRDQAGVEVARKEAQRFILDYPEWKTYLLEASKSRLQQLTVDKQAYYLTRMWDQVMQRTDPHTWNYSAILIALDQAFPKERDSRGRLSYTKPSIVGKMLSAVSTVFPGILPKGFGTGLSREAGELKDYFTFEEFDLFINNLEDTFNMSKLGWEALFKQQTSIGCREGSKTETGVSVTGILSLRWEDINFETKRCSLHDKGGRGSGRRIWKNLPMGSQLFPWINSWEALIRYHQERFGYIPTNDRHETGLVFFGYNGRCINYEEYRHQFHDTRKRCNGRIAGDKETLRPHIIRRTHAQWLVKLWYPIEQICGIFPDGHFGVGWDNPKVLLKYYITMEDEQRFKAEKQAVERMKDLGLLI